MLTNSLGFQSTSWNVLFFGAYFLNELLPFRLLASKIIYWISQSVAFQQCFKIFGSSPFSVWWTNNGFCIRIKYSYLRVLIIFDHSFQVCMFRNNLDAVVCSNVVIYWKYSSIALRPGIWWIDICVVVRIIRQITDWVRRKTIQSAVCLDWAGCPFD